MRRREFIALLGGGAVAWPLAARAQQPAKVPRIGIIDDAPIWDYFRQGLRDLGYVDGQNIIIEYRSAQGEPERTRRCRACVRCFPNSGQTKGYLISALCQ